jgi:hypothetical protein
MLTCSPAHNTHVHTHTHIYIYIHTYIYLLCVSGNQSATSDVVRLSSMLLVSILLLKKESYDEVDELLCNERDLMTLYENHPLWGSAIAFLRGMQKFSRGHRSEAQ